jgi:hypothetical protein
MPEDGLSDWAAWRNKSKQSKRVRFLSYRNHIAMLFRHETISSLGADVVSVLWYEGKKFLARMSSAPIDTMRAWYEILSR